MLKVYMPLLSLPLLTHSSPPLFLILGPRAAVHGQVAKELAEPYYLYGRALLEVARCRGDLTVGAAVV